MDLKIKSAIVHDWMVTPIGGAENVLKEIYSLFPAPIYTLAYDSKVWIGTNFENAKIESSFINRLPGSPKKFRSYLPLFPSAVERFDLSSYKVILSSSHCVAKGIRCTSDQLHICYCYTPMRYAWDLSEEYLKEAKLQKGFKGFAARYFLHRLQKWDARSSVRVNYFIAISHFVADRIRRFYRRPATVIYPPVDTDYFQLGNRKENFYLTASRLVPYKKIDLIVEAFSQRPDRKLIVVGDGPEMKRLKRLATGNIEILGYQSNAVLLDLMQRAKAFVFAAIEDFGILPVEAMATGTPVIALRQGGAAETVIDGITGLFFENQDISSINQAIDRFEKKNDWDSEIIRKHALQFSTARFRQEYQSYVENCFVKFLHGDQ